MWYKYDDNNNNVLNGSVSAERDPYYINPFKSKSNSQYHYNVICYNVKHIKHSTNSFMAMIGTTFNLNIYIC